MSSHKAEQDFVFKTIESRDVHFVRFWFVDVLGQIKSFAVVTSELENAFEAGMGFDGSCIEGFSQAAESDVLAFPEAETFQILPWRPASNAVGRMFCTLRTPDGNHFEGDVRNVLARVVGQAHDMGYVFNVGPELEYYYFKDPQSTETLDRGGYFDLTSLDYASDLRRETVLTLEKMGIPVEYSHHEAGPSQHEIDLRFTDAQSMADAVITYKMVVKEIALKHGVYASFMPKPRADLPGNGMHVHMSLFDFDGNNCFFDTDDPQGFGLSSLAKHYLAGILKYAPEFCLLTNQYVNSYKRFVPGEVAPRHLSWARKSRSALIRVPGYRPGSEETCRLELRSPDTAANPYLCFAGVLAAGLAGIKEELPLPNPTEGMDLYRATAMELKQMGFEILPQTLGEAVEKFAQSQLMKDTLGEHIHSYLVQAKREEWTRYCIEVTDWERDRYLGVL